MLVVITPFSFKLTQAWISLVQAFVVFKPSHSHLRGPMSPSDTIFCKNLRSSADFGQRKVRAHSTFRVRLLYQKAFDPFLLAISRRSMRGSKVFQIVLVRPFSHSFVIGFSVKGHSYDILRPFNSKGLGLAAQAFFLSIGNFPFNFPVQSSYQKFSNH